MTLDGETIKIAEPKKKIPSNIEQIIKADFWANNHYPQMTLAKHLATGSTFLELFLDGNITWSEYSETDFSKYDIKQYLDNANKTHAAYKGYPISNDRLVKLISKSRETFGDFCLTKVFDLPYKSIKDIDKFLTDSSNRQHIQTVYEIYKSGYEALKDPKSLEIAAKYRDSQRVFLEKKYDPDTVFSNKDQLQLELYWRQISDNLSEVVNVAVKNENSISKMPLSKEKIENICYEFTRMSVVETYLPKN